VSAPQGLDIPGASQANQEVSVAREDTRHRNERSISKRKCPTVKYRPEVGAVRARGGCGEGQRWDWEEVTGDLGKNSFGNVERTEAMCKGLGQCILYFLKSPSIYTEAATLHNLTGRRAHL